MNILDWIVAGFATASSVMALVVIALSIRLLWKDGHR